MALAISVPLNTMLADLDESLRGLLKRELGRHGFDGVEVVFDAPTKEWAAGLSSPTVDLFLYDLQEATEKAEREWTEERSNGRAVESRPPLRVDASYAVTAWTREVEDEHRLLSQVLAVLYAYPEAGPMHTLLRLNPMTHVIVAYQEALFYGAVVHWHGLALAAVAAVLAFAAGSFLFERLRDTLAEEV